MVRNPNKAHGPCGSIGVGLLAYPDLDVFDHIPDHPGHATGRFSWPVILEELMLVRVAFTMFVGACLCSTARSAETITFRKQSTTVGQRMVQTAFVHTATQQTYEQSNQIISEEDREVRNTQVRHITTVAMEPPAVDVTYVQANLRIGKNRFFAKRESLPVEQKTYRVTRAGEDLQIRDKNGHLPPIAERKIVERTMSWVGKPNELAEFLNGRTVAVTERIDLPPTVAAKIFGGAVGMKTIAQATLTLRKIKRVGGESCGEFNVHLVGSPMGDAAKQSTVTGKIAVQANTCRTTLAEVESDLDMAEKRGPTGATFTVRNRGKVQLKIKADFDKSL